jgi:hypothetical protein
VAVTVAAECPSGGLAVHASKGRVGDEVACARVRSPADMRLGRRRHAVVCAGASVALMLGCGDSSSSDHGGDRPKPSVREVSGAEIIVNGLPMERAAPAIRRQCTQTAKKIGYPALCPGFLPAEAYPMTLMCEDGPREAAIGTGCGGLWRRWEMSDMRFPPESVLGEGHLGIQAGPRSVGPRDFVYGPAGAPPRSGVTVLSRRVRIAHGWSGRWALARRAYGSAFHGHSVLVWHVRGRTYGLGVHGLDAPARRIGLWLARRSRLERG